MISEELQKKIDRSIRLLRSIHPAQLPDGTEQPIEIAYSGGKDSDVILQLAKEAGINYRAIYKNTTIDPPGTVKHARDMGAEVLMPRDGMTFFKLIEQNGFPNRFMRFCCKFLKEYKVLDKAVMGVRKAESRKRNERYQEPTECRFYGSKKEHVEAIYPILEWTDEDVRDFILDRGIRCAPVYYDEQGDFHVERRLGCMCCPLASKKKRIEQFKQRPNMVKAYIRAGQKHRDTHPDKKWHKIYDSVYKQFYRDVFYDRHFKFVADTECNLFGEPDYKAELERIFNIKFRDENV